MYTMVLGILWISTLWIAVRGQDVAQVEWMGEDPWTVEDNYRSLGSCRFTFSQAYKIGRFKVNVTFDKVLADFDDYNNWQRINESTGYWYYSKSTWRFPSGSEQWVNFTAEWATSSGIATPTAYCSSNVGTAVVQTTTTTTSTTSTTSTTAATTTTAATSGFPTYDYSDVMNKSMDFYAAQRSGPLPADNAISWRGDSALNDTGNNGEDLTGGYYDAGDHVKFNFPMAASLTVLAWGQYKFSDAYDDFGLSDRMRETIKWGTDYLLKCWNGDSANPELYGQVGHGQTDHSSWGRPEEMTMSRPAYSLTDTAPGTDLAADTASALAAAYLVFNSTDATYATELLDAAEEIFAFADEYRGTYSDSITDAAQYYSSSGYVDELMLAASILYEATGNSSYKTKAEDLFSSASGWIWAFSWDDKSALAQLILSDQTGNTAYRSAVDNFLSRYRNEATNSLTFIDGVLAWRSEWSPLRYAGNAAFIAVLAAEAGIDDTTNAQWAQSQIDFILGNNSNSISYVIGFGSNYPLKPHHRSSSCPDLPDSCGWSEYSSTDPNPQVLVGALIGGPFENGTYVDERDNYYSNEVACDYNAGFTSALAGLTHFRDIL